MSYLKDQLIKLAYEKPKFRKDLLPLIRMAAETFKCPNCGTKVMKQTGYCVKCEKKVEPSNKESALGWSDRRQDTREEILEFGRDLSVFGDLDRREVLRRLKDGDDFKVIEDDPSWGWTIEFPDRKRVDLEV